MMKKNPTHNSTATKTTNKHVSFDYDSMRSRNTATDTTDSAEQNLFHRPALRAVDENTKNERNELDSPMTQRRRWNVRNEVRGTKNFRATAMDKVMIMQRRIESLEQTIVNANEFIKMKETSFKNMENEVLKMNEQKRIMNSMKEERRKSDKEMAENDIILRELKNDANKEITRLTIECESLRKRESLQIEDLSEALKNKTMHVEDLENTVSRLHGREMLMARERDVALIESQRAQKELQQTKARCVALSKAHEEAIVNFSSVKAENNRIKEENIVLVSTNEELNAQVDTKRKENDLLYAALENKNLVIDGKVEREMSECVKISQRVEFKEALQKATYEAERKASECESKLESERKDITDLICSFEEELKNKTEKIASLRVELANARVVNTHPQTTTRKTTTTAFKEQTSVLLGEVEEDDYERSEELKRLDATRWTLQKELEREIADANMLRDRNKKLSHEMDKLKREYSYAQEKLEAQDLHLEMLEKTHRSARETLKAAEEEKFQAERAIRNAKTDAEMAVKRKDSQAVIENREMKMQVQSLERQLERAEDRVKAAELDAANALVKVNEEVEKRVKLEMDFQEKETKIKVKERDLRNKLEHSRQALHFILLATPQTLSKLLDAAEVTRDTGIIDQSTKPRDVEENLWLRVVDATASLNRLRNEDS